MSFRFNFSSPLDCKTPENETVTECLEEPDVKNEPSINLRDCNFLSLSCKNLEVC